MFFVHVLQQKLLKQHVENETVNFYVKAQNYENNKITILFVDITIMISNNKINIPLLYNLPFLIMHL